MEYSKEYGGRFLHRLDPLSKLVALACLAALTMHWDDPRRQIVLLLTLIVAAKLGAGMSWHRLLRRFAWILGFGLPLFVVTALAVQLREGSTEGPLLISGVALSDAAAVTLRMVSLFLSSLAYIESTDPKDFVVIMTTRLKLPYRFVFGISMALTFLPLLAEEGRQAAAARKLRMGRQPRGIQERLEQRRGQLVTVFTGAIRRVEQTAGAMDAKGFGAYRERTFLREVPFKAIGIGTIMISLILTAGLWML
ncbi:energy-coupling factor transporter transmembrane protein EcfT [Paenibacillus sp. DXFW5]|uniref:Energy-coupling factor transporter transmembrane protein EcfT n=1 Tax=Paenibacillus rhizolycopersici TaxID=2780073 RepID=A0ABS2H9T0_9BACL|nr:MULTISPECIES: energy-coupling factor transporter transmembrane component T [Paenibacillus]MBM6997593.1 energy-coupling factor transporter transmembrane protein EcfT [Paenibacillus rhizolycopersici]GIP49879.1 cobalt ABC transporter permease [Paenibacillus sp. J53TS2]